MTGYTSYPETLTSPQKEFDEVVSHLFRPLTLEILPAHPSRFPLHLKLEAPVTTAPHGD